jgi:uncharacterized protein YfeS
LIDEVDSLSDSRKSELNYPKENKLPNNLKFRIELITCLVDHILEIKKSESPESYIIRDNNLVVYKYDNNTKNKIIINLESKINNIMTKYNILCKIDIARLINKGKIMRDGRITPKCSNITTDQKYILKHIFYDNLPTCLLQVYQLNYGLKDDDYIDANNLTLNDPRFNLLAVPYTSAKKPANESKFTDIDLTLFYTYYSLKKLEKLRNHDISKIIDIYKSKHSTESYILNDNKTNAIKELQEYLNKNQDLELSKFNYMFESMKEYKKLPYFNQLDNISKKLLQNTNFINKYLYELIKDKSNIPADFNDNISFIDIMSSSFTKIRIGFTGTPSELVPIDENSHPKYDFHFQDKSYIQESGSYNEYINSMFRLHDNQFLSKKITIYIFNDNNNIIDDVLKPILEEKTYDCLIDVAGLFKDYIPKVIGEKIDSFINENANSNKKVVYMDIINNRYVYNKQQLLLFIIHLFNLFIN